MILSRGAESAIFIEKSPSAANIIKQNLAELGIVAEVITSDVVNFRPQERFDLILADPPYDNFDIEKLTNLGGLLADSGVLVLSHPGEAPEIPGTELIKTRQYARAKISIYKK